MKVKHIIATYLIGLLFTTTGALGKIIHMMILSIPGDLWVTAGISLQNIAIILMIWKLFTTKKFNDFLNS